MHLLVQTSVMHSCYAPPCLLLHDQAIVLSLNSVHVQTMWCTVAEIVHMCMVVNNDYELYI